MSGDVNFGSIFSDHGNVFADLFGRPTPQPADKQGRIVCAGCGDGYPFVTDLRPWPPDTNGLRFCGACRLTRALKGATF
jgi:hypothetical protein